MRADDAWTDHRTAILKAMWADGATAAEIAERLGGLSRSAVLGKIHRLRLGADGLAAEANKEQAAATSLTEPAVVERRRSRQPRRRATARPSPKPRPKRSQQGLGKTLLELTNDSCRWPHGEPGTRGFFFCGTAGADLGSGRPYCARHARLAYSSAATCAEDDDSFVIAVRQSPSIAPFDSPRRYAWRAPVNHPAPRWR